jgi:hypothetical protein
MENCPLDGVKALRALKKWERQKNITSGNEDIIEKYEKRAVKLWNV